MCPLVKRALKMEVNISQTFGGAICENWETVYSKNQSNLSYKTDKLRRGSKKKNLFLELISRIVFNFFL